MPSKPINISRAQTTVELVARYLVHNEQQGPGLGNTLMSWLQTYGLSGRMRNYFSGYYRRAEQLLKVLYKDGMVVVGFSKKGREAYYPVGPLAGLGTYHNVVKAINRYYEVKD